MSLFSSMTFPVQKAIAISKWLSECKSFRLFWFIASAFQTIWVSCFLFPDNAWFSVLRPQAWDILIMDALLHVPGNEEEKQTFRINLLNVPSPPAECTSCIAQQPTITGGRDWSIFYSGKLENIQIFLG